MENYLLEDCDNYNNIFYALWINVIEKDSEYQCKMLKLLSNEVQDELSLYVETQILIIFSRKMWKFYKVRNLRQDKEWAI